jgi:hypothetical protein
MRKTIGETIMLATAAVLLGIGFGSAFADGGQGPMVNSYLRRTPWRDRRGSGAAESQRDGEPG